ncbi:hypothetical protein EMIHUDRAFT_459195 [Emiliania huxleyi CCMP1516]|uniref:SET domain-containing protein n=2 Tax=Emiliania huxleyi TaxID=2903 RepID=A0A0D3IY31_EMIH1|nr:hypothetical protein EMIHUDRAFT_459195 [Emiliania huxleyi CCMP1516]EOD16166.1 hypothetical protein EMIHUDRAFT_459195 [Emiliania huxleyi CCMP1516]|eukprot:XP_005768595.1 hypothetical protein EMIHUDRAFT_459195 [Emiliania huxleyi CCMP1516]
MLLRLLLAGGGAGGGAPSARFGAPSSAPCGVQLAGRGGLRAAMCEPQHDLSEGDLSEGGEVGASVCDQEVLSVSERELLSMSDDELLALADRGEEALADGGEAQLVQAAPPVYDGPTPAKGLQGLVCSVELPEVGLGVDSVTLPAGVAFCGYAAGGMEMAADSEGGKTVGFALRSADTSVFFEQQLWSVADLLAPGSGVRHIAGHEVERDAGGRVQAISPDPDWGGARYFVPSREQGDLSIMNIGQMSNDLAIVARPSRPVSTLAADVTFRNSAPMELGCEYGERYWSRRAEAGEDGFS